MTSDEERKEFAERVREARRHAGLTQVELARRLGKSQTLVSHAENGAARIGARFVDAVMAACELSRDWGAPERTDPDAALPDTGLDVPGDQIAGLDPETLLPVRRGSKRDLELREKFEWWSNRFEW